MDIQRFALIPLEYRRFHPPLVIKECESLHIFPLVKPLDGDKNVTDFSIQAALREMTVVVVPEAQWEVLITNSFLHEVHDQLRMVYQQEDGKDSGSVGLCFATNKIRDIRAMVP